MCGPQAVPSTVQAATYVVVIKVTILLQVGVAVLDLFSHTKFLREGIIGIFLPILLFVAFYKLSHQSMLIYAFMSMFFSVTFLVYIMQIVQHREKIRDLEDKDKLYFITACVSLGFYVLTSIFSFFPYREFKAIDFAEKPELANFAPEEPKHSSEDFVGYNEPPLYDEPPRHDKKKKTFEVFQGQGVRIG